MVCMCVQRAICFFRLWLLANAAVGVPGRCHLAHRVRNCPEHPGVLAKTRSSSILSNVIFSKGLAFVHQVSMHILTEGRWGCYTGRRAPSRQRNGSRGICALRFRYHGGVDNWRRRQRLHAWSGSSWSPTVARSFYIISAILSLLKSNIRIRLLRRLLLISVHWRIYFNSSKYEMQAEGKHLFS